MSIAARKLARAARVGLGINLDSLDFSFVASSAWAGGFSNCADTAWDKPAQTDKTAVITGGDVFGWNVSDASIGGIAGDVWEPSNGGLTTQIHGIGVAYSPSVDKRLYMQFGIGSNPSGVTGGLCLSQDGGHNWKQAMVNGSIFGNVTGNHPRAVGNTIHAVNVSSSEIIRVGSANGVTALLDNGALSAPTVGASVLPNCVCSSIAADPQDPLVTYIAVRETWNGVPTLPGLYKVTWGADGYSSITNLKRIDNSTNTSRITPGRVDRIVATVEDGITVVYAGTENGILRYPANRPLTAGCDDWNGDGTGGTFPNTSLVGGICVKKMASGPAVVYAGLSPAADVSMANHMYRTIDGGKTWQAIDTGFLMNVVGDNSGDIHYALQVNPQFRPNGATFDIGTFMYIPNIAPNTDRFLCFGRTCIWGADINTTSSSKGTVGQLRIFSFGINGSQGHSIGKDPVRNVLYGGDTDWDVLWWRRQNSTDDYMYNRMPKQVSVAGAHGIFAMQGERDHGVMMLGCGNNILADSSGSLGYATYTDPSGTNPWHMFPSSGASGQPPGGSGRVVGVTGFFLPANYISGPWAAANANDFVMLYSRSQQYNSGGATIAPGGLFIGVGRFPNVPNGLFTADTSLNNNLVVDWTACNGVTGFNQQSRVRFVVGSLGVNATGGPDGRKGWIYATTPGGAIMRSSDYGVTWSTIPGAPTVFTPPINPYASSIVDAASSLIQDSTNLDRLIYQSDNGPVRINDAKSASPVIELLYTSKDGNGNAINWGSAPGPAASQNYSNGSQADAVMIMRNALSGVTAGVWWSTNAFSSPASSVVWHEQTDPNLKSVITAANDLQLTIDQFGRPRALISCDSGGYRVALVR